jgi:radical SAM superfamily enzyme YgiQ (UPF0313 family)
MKCALIIPSWIPEEIFSSKTAGSQINYWQPLGTLYVASSLLKAGHTVQFLNGAFLGHAEILNTLRKFKPEFIGIYSTTFGWNKALQTASDIKHVLKDVFIAVGGPYPVAMQEKCLRDSRDIDAVVTGEGEITVAEILDRLTRNKDLQGDAKDYIPPPATYKRKPVAVIITARGCNRRCIFCFQIDKQRKSGIRYRSVENVLQEIEHCLKQGYKEIKFIDDTLAADYDRAMQLAKEIKQRKLNFTWFASACVHQVDKPLLKAFKSAGCWAILLGAESGVQKNLNTIRKGITLAQTKKAVQAAKEVGLTVYTPFIFGIPGETFEDGLKTIEFACELNPDIANFHALTPFPGTELHDNIEKYGTVSGDLTDFTYQGVSFIPHTMTRREIAELRQIAFKRFYSRPGYIIGRIFALRNVNDVKAAAKGVQSLLWIWAKKDIFRKRESHG